ncbi:MAG: PEP/pyruvate-binding domain-containing protein [Nitrospirae bacterium]|nr:PEP/pyruvate-binding domain-containing protein [Nitrospirota bacterium]
MKNTRPIHDRIAYLVEINKLKNAIIMERGFNEQIRTLCIGIIRIFDMARVLYYIPLEGNRLHAAFDFVKKDGDIKMLEGADVCSSFNPPRKITESERMYLASRNGYYIKLNNKMSDNENVFILVCIKDSEGRPAGYLKIEKDISAGCCNPDAESYDMTPKNEQFVNYQRSLLTELQGITESIVEVSHFITLSALYDPYCDLNKDIYSDEKLDAFTSFIKRLKASDMSERFKTIPELIKLLDAESIRLYSKSASDIVKTIGLWSKESDIPTPVYKSSFFLEGRKIITHGDSIYLACLKGYDIIPDTSCNPKCVNIKELSNITSYIIVRLNDTMKRIIGFLQVNYIFRGDIIHFKFHQKLKKDLSILQGIVPYFTSIPESEEFTHNSNAVVKNLTKFIGDIEAGEVDNDILFHYISDTVTVGLEHVQRENIPELIDNLKKFSYFVRDKRTVIQFFRWFYKMVDDEFKPLVVSAITIMFEHFTIEQGKELTVFKGACYDTLSQWMKSEIKAIITHQQGIEKYHAGILEQLLQLNCIFIAKYRDEDFRACNQFLEAMNINDVENTDFLLSLLSLNPSMPESYKREIFKSLYYLLNNGLMEAEKIADAIVLTLKTAKDCGPLLLSQVISTATLIFDQDYQINTMHSADEFIRITEDVLLSGDNWITIYSATLLMLSFNCKRSDNRLDLRAFNVYLLKNSNTSKSAILRAIVDFLESRGDDIDIVELDASIRLILSLLRLGAIEVIDPAREILLLLGNHVIKYSAHQKSGNFMNILINELSSTDVNYKLTIHDILYTLKKLRMEHQSIYLEPGSHSIPQASYISAISSTLGFNPFDIGEKGYHLLEIIGQCKIPVFLLLKTSAYDHYIEHNHLNNIIPDIIASIRFDDKPDIEKRIVEAGEKIHSLIINGTLPEHMQIELIDKFIKFKEHINTYDSFVTIGARSTAKGEDGRLYSFAGQFLTVLDIKTPEDFLIAVKRIWASLWSPKAISYRHDIMELDPSLAEKFAIENIGMGVVIQGVVDAAVSGVIMTLESGGIVVSASYGLEGGTRSDIAADKYTLNLHAEITDKIISPQTKAIVWDSETLRFEVKEIPESDRRIRQKVSDVQLKILFEIIDKLKQLPIFMGLQLDVEYAVSLNNDIFITQIRPKTGSFKELKDQRFHCDFSGLHGLTDKHLQTFTFGCARGQVSVLNINGGSPQYELEKIHPGCIIVAKHLDIANLEVYLKRRLPGAIILETCTPFAHPVLVISEMEKQNTAIPIVQIPGALDIFKNGMEVGLSVLKENTVSFYSNDDALLDALNLISGPVMYASEMKKGSLKSEFDSLTLLIGSYEKTEKDFVGKDQMAALLNIDGTQRLQVFKELYTLSLYRQVEIENLLEEQQGIEDETLSEWYFLILLKLNARQSSQYGIFTQNRIAPYIDRETLARVEEKVEKNTVLNAALREHFNDVKERNLWHPKDMMFQLNAPIFIVDPRLDSNNCLHNPHTAGLNLWEFNFLVASQRVLFHNQLGALVPYAERNRYIRGRVTSDPTQPDAIIDLGFLDNTREFYNTLEQRIGALSKLAKILLHLNFHPAAQIEILPRMTEDFKEHNIPSRINIHTLSTL